MRSLYDSDILLWSEEQSAALRSLTDGEFASSADWEHLAEAIESVGRSALLRSENGLRLMFVQAIAGYCDSDSAMRHERIRRTLVGQAEAQRDMSSSIRARLDLDRLWREAFSQAVAEIPRRILGVPPSIPRTCPFTLDELLADDFGYDLAVERLYTRLTSYRPRSVKEPAA